MSVKLTDSEGKSLKVNAWNWGVLHYTLVCCKPKLLEDEQLLEQLRFGGVELGNVEVKEIRSYLREVVLPLLKPGERMLYDFTVTDEPDDGTFYREELEKNYSLRYDVLVAVIDFLDEAKAPVHVS
jgi:hypothetical protein